MPVSAARLGPVWSALAVCFSRLQVLEVFGWVQAFTQVICDLIQDPFVLGLGNLRT